MVLGRPRTRRAVVSVTLALASMLAAPSPAPAGPADGDESLAAATLRGTAGTSDTCGRSIQVGIGVQGDPLLNRFKFTYQDGDHHLDKIGVLMNERGDGGVDFGEALCDEPFDYDLAWQWPDSRAGIVLDQTRNPAGGGPCRGRCTLILPEVFPSSHVWVLTGFRFEYLASAGDRHLDTLRVERSGFNGVAVAFNDDSDDDPFNVIVRYAWVPTSYFQTWNRDISGTVTNSGSRSHGVEPGSKVISGFAIEADDDNHVRSIGVNANIDIDSIQVTLADNNPGDSGSWRYRVRYGILR